jgi:hypothetical protein
VRAALQAGSPSDNHDALARLAGEGWGRAALAAIAVGLAGYGLWRLLDALFRSSREPSKLAVRAGGAGSGIAHLLLGWFALTLALKARSAGGNTQDEGTRSWTGWLLEQPFGTAAVVLLGLVFLAVALFQARKAWKADFMKRLGGDAPPADWLVPAGRIGFAARAVVFALIGFLIAKAGLTHRPDEAGSVGTALATLQQQPGGPWLLGAIALGFILFGLYSLVEAACRRDIGAAADRAQAALT